MSNGSGRFMFAGHAIGATARFHRLDEERNLNHVVPTLGSSVVPTSGGRSHEKVEPYRFEVQAPRRRCLLKVDRAQTLAEGRDANGIVETEVFAEVEGLQVLEKLHCDLLRMHMISTRTNGGGPVVTTPGNHIDGMRLGDIGVVVTLDEEPLTYTGTEEQFTAWHKKAGRSIATFGAYYRSTIVRNIQLVGDGPEREKMTVEGNSIRWKGFGRIILGEIHVKGHERRLTLVRLEMGSDAEGSGSAGDGHTNGSTGG